jgi:hypothetical protein
MMQPLEMVRIILDLPALLAAGYVAFQAAATTDPLLSV